MTDKHRNATVVSIDGIGAYDQISRNSMLEGLLRMEQVNQILHLSGVSTGTRRHTGGDEMGHARNPTRGVRESDLEAVQ